MTMHEMSLAEDMLEIIKACSVEQEFSRVKTVWIEVGSLSHVEPAALLFCFEAVSQNTLAENAHLSIAVITGVGSCNRCSKTFEYLQLYDPCPYCASYSVEVVEGKQMKIKNLEVE